MTDEKSKNVTIEIPDYIQKWCDKTCMRVITSERYEMCRGNFKVVDKIIDENVQLKEAIQKLTGKLSHEVLIMLKEGGIIDVSKKL